MNSAEFSDLEKLVLRYLSSISEKYDRQYPRWLKAGVVSPEDALARLTGGPA